jgi:hypothetical protein
VSSSLRLPPAIDRWGLLLVVVLQAALFLLLPMLGSQYGWAVLSPLPAEIAVDLLGGAESPLDGYDGIAAGPLASALLHVPWLAALGRVGLVQVLASLTVAVGATLASWLCARELLGGRPALLVAAMVAFPPPTTWVNQHYGAYHAIPLVTAPLGFWILMRARGAPLRVLGVAVLGSSVAWSLGSVAVVVPLVVGWWWTHRRGRDGRRASLAVVLGGLLAAAPLLAKVWLHTPYGGLLGGADHVAAATKPLFLAMPALAEVPSRLVQMLGVSFPYGHHFALHGLGPVDGLVAVLTAAAWVLALRDRRLGPWLLVPPSVVGVGLATGWFVFHPGDDVPFERDGRHMVGLVHALAFAVGGAWASLRARRPSSLWQVLPLAAALLAGGGSVITQVQAAQRAWGEGGRPDPATPFRLEGRYISGFFRGPHFLRDPTAGARSCEALPPRAANDCRRGVAMAFGFAPDPLPDVRARCAALDTPDLPAAPWCLFGRGWAEVQRQFRRPVRASAACAALPEATHGEVADCRAGVGWGLAQDFADRPGVVGAWIAELPAAERAPVTAGVGVYAGMITADPAHVARVCRRLVPDSMQARCIAGAARNRPYMDPGN